MENKNANSSTYYVTFYTSIMSPVDQDMAFNSLLVKIIEITDFFYYVKSLFKDANGEIHHIKLLIPAGNIAALIEVENGVYEELEKKHKPKQTEKENKSNKIIKLAEKKENKNEKNT